MDKVCAVILAAGDGKRMKSKFPKASCEVLFKPMIQWVVDSCKGAGVNDVCAVIGAGGDFLKSILSDDIKTVEQTQRLGTGHASAMAAAYIRDTGAKNVLILNGDAPFISSDEIRGSFVRHTERKNSVTLITAEVKNPTGYGRVIKEGECVSAIVEDRDADEATKQISEINSGCYWFDSGFLLWCLDGKLKPRNAQGEFYLTDTVALAADWGGRADAYPASSSVVLGANNRRDLMKLNAIARRFVLDRLVDDGVNIPLEDGVVIGSDVSIGCDTTILPGTIIKGKTVIGEGCSIGPNSNITDSQIGDNCTITASFVDSSKLGDKVKIGPMANLRPGCELKNSVKVGDFVEVKNSVIGEKTSVAHLTYVGDTDLGANCNLGCGVVTVNYDGTNKFRTVVGDDCFIGCNTNLIAPVSLGDRVYCAAGTTVNKNVPDDALVIGRSKAEIKPGWNNIKGRYKKR